MNYNQFEFLIKNEDRRQWLIALLSEFGAEGFEEKTSAITAFAPAEELDADKVQLILDENDLGDIEFTVKVIEPQNWNAAWEQQFEPVFIDNNRVGIRAPFHDPLDTEIELVIEPKMSFGTGHHATTASMIKLMMQIDHTGKQVFDIGSGTGVLAIVAEKIGAASVLALDNEEWAYENAIENAQRNNCSKIEVTRADASELPDRKFELIYANINRNVILDNIARWKGNIADGGLLLVSGFLEADVTAVVAAAKEHGLSEIDKIVDNGWVAISFTNK
jgi:ribosomal protein L11 methyltransferase